MTAAPETLRPGFADELLERLARDGSRRSSSRTLRRTVTGVAVTASVTLLVATRRRTR